jgi:hypothetical protein
MKLHVLGIDLGKTVFHLVGLDSAGSVVLRTSCPVPSYEATCKLRLSKGKFHRELNEPRWSGLRDFAEQSARKIPRYGGGSKKLGVIKDVESFQPELQGL